MGSNNLHLKDSLMSETAQCERYSTVKPLHFCILVWGTIL